MGQENLHNPANSPEFLEQVQLAIDGALRPDEQTAFFRKINQDPRCLETYYSERKFKAFIRQKINKKCCKKDALIERIKNHLDDNNRSIQ